jgi:short subunit dehydrogenase-like uncharacterized protein
MLNKPKQREKVLDFVIYGATGYTGRLAVEHLVKQLEFHPGLSWGIAGRNRRKLKALLEELGELENIPQILVAENTDDAALANLARSSNAVLNLAGPYYKNGEVLIQACLEHRCHYLDLSLSVESFWIAEMIEKYHAQAHERRVKIAPGCGYESLPFDMAVTLAAKALADRFDERCVSANAMVKFMGKSLRNPRNAFSGGTYASIAAFLEAPAVKRALQPGCLVEDPDRAAYLQTHSPFQLKARYDSDFNARLGPTMPIPFINPAIIYRSAELQRHLFEDHFLYREGTSLASALPYKLLELPAAMGLGFGFSAFQRLLGSDVTLAQFALKRVIDTFAPSSGNGPSSASLDEMSYEINLIATGQTGRRVRCLVKGAGHAGYRSTANIAVQAGILMGLDNFGAPRYYGVITPATAIGPVAVKALERAGVQFEITELEPLSLAVHSAPNE